ISVATAIFLLLTADRLNNLPSSMMALYGFGDGRKVELLLTDEGVKSAETLGFDPNGSRLPNVEILSKLGSEYFLKCAGCDQQRDGVKFTLPKGNVISWRRMTADDAP
ncbi:MAG: hypothetical protein ACREDR_04890, partial [Blastocatellia bacterium]